QLDEAGIPSGEKGAGQLRFPHRHGRPPRRSLGGRSAGGAAGPMQPVQSAGFVSPVPSGNGRPLKELSLKKRPRGAAIFKTNSVEGESARTRTAPSSWAVRHAALSLLQAVRPAWHR